METKAPAQGEVVVSVEMKGVNPYDVKTRSGRNGMTKNKFDKVIPKRDGAGVIEAVGSGVDSARIGQRVWIWNGQWQRPFGTAATHITLPSAQAVDLADDVSFEAAASFGIPALTASHAAFHGEHVQGPSLIPT